LLSSLELRAAPGEKCIQCLAEIPCCRAVAETVAFGVQLRGQVIVEGLPQQAAGLQAIWMAATRAEAHKAFAQFAATYQAKYPKAVEKLVKDRDNLLAFYDFPAEHWQHLRTTNPIESTFATVRHSLEGLRNRVRCLGG
jgi:hypothetical protein